MKKLKFKTIVLRQEWLVNVLLKLGWRLAYTSKENRQVYVLERGKNEEKTI